MKKLRPMPDDFAEVAPGKPQRALRNHYRTSARNISRWLDAIGVDLLPKSPIGPALRQMPVGFAADAHRSNVFLIAKYACSSGTIKRWRAEVGHIPYDPSVGLPVPDGFRLVAPSMTVSELCAHYGRGRLTVNRWLKKAGVLPAAYVRRVKEQEAPKKRAVSNFKTQPIAIQRDLTRAGLAAAFLQRRMPVSKCNADGWFDPMGDHWRCGSKVLDADQVIERAERNGWRPVEREALAA